MSSVGVLVVVLGRVAVVPVLAVRDGAADFEVLIGAGGATVGRLDVVSGALLGGTTPELLAGEDPIDVAVDTCTDLLGSG